MNGDCVREERKKKGDQEEGGRKKRSVLERDCLGGKKEGGDRSAC